MPATAPPDLLTLYPALGALHPLLARLTPMTVPTGTLLFSENDPCQGFPLVLVGEVRVSRSAVNGRVLKPYRVTPSEMCPVSSTDLFANQPLTAHGVATCHTTLGLLSPPDFQAALRDKAFRHCVLGLFAARQADLTGLTEAVSFQKPDSAGLPTLAASEIE